MGQDGIHPWVLRELTEVLTKLLSIIFQQSLSNREDLGDRRLCHYYDTHLQEGSEGRSIEHLTSASGKFTEQITLSESHSMCRTSRESGPDSIGL